MFAFIENETYDIFLNFKFNKHFSEGIDLSSKDIDTFINHKMIY